MPGARVILTGQPCFLKNPEEVHALFPDAERVMGRRIGALATMPVTVQGRPIAALVTWDDRPRDWSPMQREVLTGMAAQGGQALARAQAFEDQATAASTLQESLLPSRLPRRPDLDLTARYVPGESGLRVGGDWYDCVELGDHLVALVVGDVMGKGLHAAAVMGQMRTTLRSLTTVDPSPSVVLTAMDRATQDLAPDEIATLAYVLLDLSTGVARIARAGHLPPLLAGPRGPVAVLDDGGSPPLGVPCEVRAEANVVVPPGHLLLLYSDGMVENRETGLEPGMSHLVRSMQQLARRRRTDLDAVATALLAKARGPAGDDDITLLARRPSLTADL
jgi:serine phosphatase RsbU (regulator of sigma subunit)